MVPQRSVLVLGFLYLAFLRNSTAHAELSVAWDLRMGPSVTGLVGELADSLDRPSGGIDGGLAIRWPRASRLGLQGELLVARRSRSFQDVAGFRRSLDVTYTQVPLLARAPLRSSGKLRPYILAGPYVAWRLSSRIAPGQYVGDEPVNPNDVSSNDAGAIIGFGSDVVTERGRASIELRAGMSFVNLLDDRARVGGTLRVLTLLLAIAPWESAQPGDRE